MHVCMHVYLSRGIYTSVYMKYLYQWLCKQVVREAELIVSIECIYTHQCEHVLCTVVICICTVWHA